MNARIKLLAEQATTYLALDIDGGEGWIFDKEKFANLIISECINQLNKPEYAMNHPEDLSDYNRGWVNGRLLGVEHIEQHFRAEV